MLLLLLFSCSDSNPKKSTLRGEYITRTHDDFAFIAEPQLPLPREPYPWEKPLIGNHPPITKEHFRCKGSSSNPERVYFNGKENIHLRDCGGPTKHSLPLQDGKEFVYPILIDLLNYIQAKTERRVIITSGHRCPDHSAYAEPENPHSKHTVGAEVSFYVQGLESQPEKIVALLQQYYAGAPFERYHKEDTNVSTPPWYNKEIFIKLFKPTEGRNADNRHPYPYLAIQVRHDRDRNCRVLYDWNMAHKNFLRK